MPKLLPKQNALLRAKLAKTDKPRDYESSDDDVRDMNHSESRQLLSREGTRRTAIS